MSQKTGPDRTGPEGTRCEFPFAVTVQLSLMLPQRLNGLTKIDSKLACLHGLLEKIYSNDHNAGYTYVDPTTSDSIPLTPFIMKEWARAIVTFPY
jgi:hypothetical protein